jgi:hypothetical protein
MTPNKLLLIVAGVCELFAALVAAFGIGIGPVLAWIAGGLAAFFFAQVV